MSLLEALEGAMAIIKEVFGASTGQLGERRNFRLNFDEFKRLEDASGVSFDTPDRAILSRLYWDIEKSIRPAEINPTLSPVDRKHFTSN